MFYEAGYERGRLTAEFERRSMDFDDLQKELAGLDVGRITRFLGNRQHHAETERNRTRDAMIEHMLSALQSRMLDPEYAAAYNGTMDMLREYERAAEAALRDAEQRLGEEQEALDRMLDRAGTLDDGRKVFRDEQGRVWTSDHELVEGMDADDVDWPPGSPLYDRYREQTDAVTAAQGDVDAIRDYQVNVLGEIRDRLSDERNPADMDEFEAMQERMQAERPAAMLAGEEPAPTHASTVAPSTIATPVF